MKTKRPWIFFAAALIMASIPAFGQALRSGEMAVFMKSGDLIIDRIDDISSTRLVLETANNGEFPLRDIWMINGVNDAWDFPEEREQLETADHYVFLKNGGVSTGRINDFSSDRRVFQFESGEEFPVGQIRRIYFSRNVPRALLDQAAPAPATAGDFTGVFERIQPRPGVVLTLGEDGTAMMEVGSTLPVRPVIVMTGRWEAAGLNRVVVRLDAQTGGLEQRVFAFDREGDVLVGTGADRRLNGEIRLQRR